MSTEVWRRMIGHSLVLVLAWSLWRGLEVWAGPIGTSMAEDSTIAHTYATKDDCLQAARTKRRTRGAVLRRYQGADQVSIERWVCLPSGVPPEKARFE
jgi:hypothetical protein